MYTMEYIRLQKGQQTMGESNPYNGIYSFCMDLLFLLETTAHVHFNVCLVFWGIDSLMVLASRLTRIVIIIALIHKQQISTLVPGLKNGPQFHLPFFVLVVLVLVKGNANSVIMRQNDQWPVALVFWLYDLVISLGSALLRLGWLGLVFSYFNRQVTSQQQVWFCLVYLGVLVSSFALDPI